MTAEDSRVLLCLEQSQLADADDCELVYDGVDYGRNACRRAFHCPTFLRDRRVLRNLLVGEKNCRPAVDFLTSQPDIKPYMRDTVTSWMLEVIEEQRCDEDVFSMACNYLDRSLSSIPVRKSELQLFGTVCMFLATKFKDTVIIPADHLVMYTDYSITVDQLLECELLVLQALNWDLSAITPHDFLEQLLCRLPIESRDRMTSVKRHAQTFIAMCAADISFSSYMPSKMAAASICAAASGLMGHKWCEDVRLVHRLHKLIRTDEAEIKACQDRIELLLNNRVRQTASDDQQSGSSSPSSSSLSSSKSESSCPPVEIHPSTPTDIRDIRVH